MERDVALIANPAAGCGRLRRLLPAVEASLRADGVRYHLELTCDLDDARRLAEKAAADGEVAAAFGGDGLVGAVAGALAGGEGQLAIVPGGRGNDAARALGIPRSAVAACAVFRRGREQVIDLGAVDGRPFIGIASCGFDSEVNRIARTAAIPSSAVYAYAALRALLSWEPATFSVEVDGVTIEHTGYNAAAANSPAYGGGMHLAPDARLDDGLLEIITVSHVSKLRFLAQFPKVFSGRHLANPEVGHRRSAAVRIDADRPFEVYADGEPMGRLPVTVATVPAAVRVLLP